MCMTEDGSGESTGQSTGELSSTRSRASYYFVNECFSLGLVVNPAGHILSTNVFAGHVPEVPDVPDVPVSQVPEVPDVPTRSEQKKKFINYLFV